VPVCINVLTDPTISLGSIALAMIGGWLAEVHQRR
jgi:hypothetical protein